MRLTVLLLTLAVAGWSQTPSSSAPRAKAAAGHAAAAGSGNTYVAPDYRSLQFPPLGQLKVPEIPTYTLSNGIRLYLLENHELPLVSGFALIRTGNLFDPPDKIGLATLTGMVMRTGGTENRTGEQLDTELENVAASVESSIGESSGRVGFSCLKENLPQVLTTWLDVLTKPAFRQDKLDLAKTEIGGGIARRNDDSGEIASREFTSLIYGKDNAYGWDLEYKHLANIQRSDLVGFYQRYFFPANVTIAIQGDFSSAELKAQLDKMFASWTVQQPKVPAFVELKPKASPGVYLAVKNDVTQSTFQIGHLGGLLNDKDLPALSVMSDILGSGFSSRLFTNVRTKLGYAYSIGGGWGATYDHPGIFSVSGSTQSANTVDAIKATLGEIDRIRTSEVTATELNGAKQGVLNGFVFNFDSPSKTLARMVTYDYYGYPHDFIQQYQKGIAAVTKADVLRVAKERVHPDWLTTLVVGKPDDFKKPLSELGRVHTLDLTIPPPPQAAAPRRAETQ